MSVGPRVLLLLAVGLAAAWLGAAASEQHLFRRQELGTLDTRFALRGPQKAPAVLVVGIGAAAYDDLGVLRFPRSTHARVIDRLRRADARVIAYAVQFTERTSDREDGALLRAVGRAGNVVLATDAVDGRGRTGVFGGDERVRRFHARVGDSQLPLDADGRIRRVDYAVGGLESLPLVAAERALGRRIRPSELQGRSALIDFAGGPGTIREVSFSRVLRGQVAPSVFRGKIVVVGATDPNAGKSFPTSSSGDGLMSGPEITANAIESALRGFPLRRLPQALALALIVLLALAPPLAGLRLRPLRAFALALLAGGAYAAAAQLAFDRGLVLPVVYPLGALVVAAVGALGVHYLFAALERERVRDTFARFVPRAVVSEVLARADGARLGGLRVEASVLFCDLRGFTTFSQERPAEQVIDVLNRYLTEMSAAILAHGGTLVSYLGDGLMAVFGAPLEQADHADRALAAAREMVERRLPAFNRWLGAEQLGAGFKIGVGLNTGELMAGNLGSEERLEYTAIGDVVNTASRIEALTKGTPHMLFLAEATRRRLTAPPAELVDIGELAIRGRSGRIRLWTLPAPAAARTEQTPAAAAAR